ncbi:hypothetical protein Agabi119p4_10687 [Agaricus bisporus var. burnettii]|uniref:Uncharacterized protein n=1 Tax=Agaricus bisporus var. burnettii TaxID=192524 RepID=A0A8H7C320_AGABI|nr:hypothetical protein Agabi119p4_10687 [Agaricus bisporus var. burnettii]
MAPSGKPHRQQSSAKPFKPGRSKDRVKETNKEAARRKKRELEQEAEDARLEAEIKACRASRALAEAEAAQAASEAKKRRVSSSKARPKTPEPYSEEEEEEVKPKRKGKVQAKVELSESSSEEEEDDNEVEGTPEGDDYEAEGEVTPPSKKTIPRPKRRRSPSLEVLPKKAGRTDKARDAGSVSRSVKPRTAVEVEIPVRAPVKAKAASSKTRLAQTFAQMAARERPPTPTRGIAPRRPQELIDSYGLVSSLPYLDFSRDLFMVTESLVKSKIPAGSCVNCTTNFTECVHRMVVPDPDLAAANLDVRSELEEVVERLACTSCKQNSRSHCSHSKPPEITQFLAEALRSLTLSSESHLRVSARNLSVGATELLGLQRLTRLASDAARHAADILEAKKAHTHELDHPVKAGLVSDINQLPALFDICEQFFPPESNTSPGGPDLTIVEVWHAYSALLAFIHDVHGVPNGSGHAWSSMPEHPGFLATLMERNLAASSLASESSSVDLSTPTPSQAIPTTPGLPSVLVNRDVPPIAVLHDQEASLSPVSKAQARQAGKARQE